MNSVQRPGLGSWLNHRRSATLGATSFNHKSTAAVAGIAGSTPMFAAMNLDAPSRLAMGEIVTGNYFQVLGVPVAIGRPIQPQDDAPSAPRVAVVSYRYWQREMASSPDVIGREL